MSPRPPRPMSPKPSWVEVVAMVLLRLFGDQRFTARQLGNLLLDLILAGGVGVVALYRSEHVSYAFGTLVVFALACLFTCFSGPTRRRRSNPQGPVGGNSGTSRSQGPPS